jgi:hypothetical protein
MDWNTGAGRDTEDRRQLPKFEEGPNKFRILSNPIMGWEYWTERKAKEKGRPRMSSRSMRI